MTDDKNTDIDKAVMTAIASGFKTAGTIERETQLGLRDVDKALQRLKRAGRIEFRTTPYRRWVIVSAPRPDGDPSEPSAAPSVRR